MTMSGIDSGPEAVLALSHSIQMPGQVRASRAGQSRTSQGRAGQA